MLKMCNPTLSTSDWRVRKDGFKHVARRIYKSEARSNSGVIDLEIVAQEPDLKEPTEKGRPDGMSDVEEYILKGYNSGSMEEDSLLGFDTEAEEI